mmetsp:Transcript_11322/g.33313  ORF Transcript_11322/g.33313 Transcript_11322/m.33313 type:complete len:370 (+) Transcript_11322:44-1153(+)
MHDSPHGIARSSGPRRDLSGRGATPLPLPTLLLPLLLLLLPELGQSRLDVGECGAYGAPLFAARVHPRHPLAQRRQQRLHPPTDGVSAEVAEQRLGRRLGRRGGLPRGRTVGGGGVLLEGRGPFVGRGRPAAREARGRRQRRRQRRRQWRRRRRLGEAAHLVEGVDLAEDNRLDQRRRHGSVHAGVGRVREVVSLQPHVPARHHHLVRARSGAHRLVWSAEEGRRAEGHERTQVAGRRTHSHRLAGQPVHPLADGLAGVRGRSGNDHRATQPRVVPTQRLGCPAVRRKRHGQHDVAARPDGRHHGRADTLGAIGDVVCHKGTEGAKLQQIDQLGTLFGPPATLCALTRFDAAGAAGAATTSVVAAARAG